MNFLKKINHKCQNNWNWNNCNHYIFLHFILAAPSMITKGHLGMIMLGMIIASIILGFPIAFTLMGLGMFFGFIGFGNFSAVFE